MNVTYDVKVLKLGSLEQASVVRIGYVQHGEAIGQDDEDDGADDCNSAGNEAADEAADVRRAAQAGKDVEGPEGIRE